LLVLTTYYVLLGAELTAFSLLCSRFKVVVKEIRKRKATIMSDQPKAPKQKKQPPSAKDKKKLDKDDGAATSKKKKQLKTLKDIDDAATKKRMNVAGKEYSKKSQLKTLKDLDEGAMKKRLDSVKKAYMSITAVDKRRQGKSLAIASKEFLGVVQYHDFVHRQEITAKANMQQTFMSILTYTDAMEAAVTLMRKKMLKAKDFNKAFGALSVAQIALGAAAVGLGITLIVISCGAAAPVVAAAATLAYIELAGTVVGATGTVVGFAGSHAQTQRDAVMKGENKTQKAVKNLAATMLETDVEEGAALGVEAIAEAASGGQAIVTGVATAGFGVLGGFYAVGTGVIALEEAVAFTTEQLYNDSKADWDAHWENLRRFLRGLEDLRNPYVAKWKKDNESHFRQIYHALWKNMADLVFLQRRYAPEP
jgi:hypothetical protein